MIGWKITNYHLTINYSKTCYLLFSKHPHTSVNSKFSVPMNHSKVERSNSVKYQGLLIDDKLHWSLRAQYLSLQLAKCCSMLYQVQGYVTEQTLIMFYHILRVVALVMESPLGGLSIFKRD